MKRKILIVEDSQIHLDLCTQILDEQYEIITARNGKEGVDKAREFNPDLVLMDLELPEVNGWDATRQIKHNTPSIPVVVLTAHTQETDERRAREAGCDDYLTKPYLPDQLRKVVEENIRKEDPQKKNPEHPKTIQKKYKILVVDHDQKNAELLKQQLEFEGYEVALCSRGKQILDVASEVNPDLVMLNVVVTDLYGLQICKLLKDHFRDKYLPIIFMASKEELKSRSRGKGAGPDDYLEKPYSTEDLKRCVELQLKKIKLHENYEILSKSYQELSEIFKDTETLVNDILFKQAKS